jgi:hypothetical protein
MEEILKQLTEAELVALIHQMVDRYPDLELLVMLSAAGDAEKRPAVDPVVIRRQVDNAFFDAEDSRNAASAVAWKVEEVIKIGNNYAEQQDWRNAATVYENVTQTILSNYETVYDHDGDLSWKVNECMSGLGGCLAGTQDPIQRETFLRVLLDTYRWDVDYGGVGIGEDVPDIILEHATPEERQHVAGWVRAAMPVGGGQSATWQGKHFGAFLLELEKDTLDDESFLQICRQTGQRKELIDRLLTLGRVDEAVAEVRQEQDYSLLAMAELFGSHGYDNRVEELIRERARVGQDRRLVEWLKEQAKMRGDFGEALTMAEALFWQFPSLQGYQEFKNLAQTLGRWEGTEGLQMMVMARLVKASKYALLTEIHLKEDEVDRALETLAQVHSSSRRWGPPLRIQVARAAEKELPRAAIDIYVRHSEKLIEMRGRSNYAEAAKYLCRVRDLYRRLGEPEAWDTLLSDLRARNRRLQAFKDELNKAGL